MTITKGQIYQHFKGNYYYVEDIAYDSNSNTEQELTKIVIYRALYGDNKLWIRPYDEFNGYKIQLDNTQIKRFTLINLQFIDVPNRNI